MAGLQEQLLLVFLFTVFVNCQANQEVNIPTTELLYATQRASTLPMTLECPSPKYKFIEVLGVTFANDTDVTVASTHFPGIDQATNEECLASLLASTNQHAQCTVSMQAFSFDDVTKTMDKVVTYDCRKTQAGDSSKKIKTLSKKKGTINIMCTDKEAVPEIIDISLEDGRYVNVVQLAWKCNEENIESMSKGKGSHCQIKRDEGYLNDSQMTVKYKCSTPPKRDVDELVQEKGNGKRGK